MVIENSEAATDLEKFEHTGPVVIIGSGPVGVRVAEEILKISSCSEIVIYGDEPWRPYNRARLSLLLSGEIKESEIDYGHSLLEAKNVILKHRCPVTSIDRRRKQVIDINGQSQRYSYLVIATGSRPYMPSINGIDKKGVSAFRSLSDTYYLLKKKAHSRAVSVIGGGLLGVEAALAMKNNDIDVSIVEHASKLMHTVLDHESAKILHEYLLEKGVRVVLEDKVAEITGSDSVESIVLDSGTKIHCDTVVVTTGTVPNVELASDAGLAVDKGIVVDDRMQSTDKYIYSVGECAQHRNSIYRLLSPGLEQARVAAKSITGSYQRYYGSVMVSQLKIVDRNLSSIGKVNEACRPGARQYSYRENTAHIYRKIILDENRLSGAVCSGIWLEQEKIRQAIVNRKRIWPWQIFRFKRTGLLWAESLSGENDREDNRVICNCANITRDQIHQALKQGCRSFHELRNATGVCGSCGTCEPVVRTMLPPTMHNDMKDEMASGASPAFMFLSVLVPGLLLLFYGLSQSNHISSLFSIMHWDRLWHDSLLKQASGFSILTLILAEAMITLRKRIKRTGYGNMHAWRVFHVTTGIFVILSLLLHTGFRLGNNLDFYLMSLLLTIIIAGSASALFVPLNHKPVRKRVNVRRQLTLLHTFLLWPMPALLGFHIFKTYYF